MDEDGGRARRKRRLDAQLAGMRQKLGDAFETMWLEAERVFRANLERWEAGKIPSPYSLEETDAVREQQLADLRENPEQVNCNKLYQALERWKRNE